MAKYDTTGTADGDASRPLPTTADGRLSVIVEIRHQPGGSGSFAMGVARSVEVAIGPFTLDESFQPVRMGVGSDGMSLAADTYIVRGTVADESALDTIRSRPEVAGAWLDTVIAPFATRRRTARGAGARRPASQPAAAASASGDEAVPLNLAPGFAPCPIPPCDCDPATPKGSIADVAVYLGVPSIWAAGFRGAGVIVGVVDGGITAAGRPVLPGETPRRVARVVGGWPTATWGTQAGSWQEHGNMCATDVLGMAPDAQLYDLRIAGGADIPATISRALQAYDWAIAQHRVDGTPHVLSNSWGIYQESWDATYARNPNHPFTRKVLEAIGDGILVLFAAGNCGDTCPDGRCGADNGPGRSIWGANGHREVMTVGAVNRNEQFIGYSSRGPAALEANKPDFCSVSHFGGYFTSDTGTSAATPIAAGVVALLRQANPAAQQAQVLDVLRRTAKDIGPAGFDQHSGAGIIRAFDAFLDITGRQTRPPQCVRQTIDEVCRLTTSITCVHTHPPECLRLTTDATCRVTTSITTCPRQTSPPVCPRRTTPALCLRQTLAGCPRQTLAGCPRVTLACGVQPPEGGMPQVDPYGYAPGYVDPYGQGDPYAGAYADPYADPQAWDPEAWVKAPGAR